jgi:hypothetical protein
LFTLGTAPNRENFSPGRPAVRGFLCVPSMNDSLEVEVLYPA